MLAHLEWIGVGISESTMSDWASGGARSFKVGQIRFSGDSAPTLVP